MKHRIHSKFMIMAIINIQTLLEHGASYRHIVSGEEVFHEGTPAAFYYQIVDGFVRWSNFTEDGKEVLQLLAGPGESIGELPLFDNIPYAASAIAETNGVLLKLPIEAFRRLLNSCPDIHFQFTKLFCERLRFKFFLLKEIVTFSPTERIQRILEYLKSIHQNICPDCLKVKLTRQQLANLTGLRVETVIRGIKCLEKKGILRIEKGKVFLNESSSERRQAFCFS